MLDEGGAGAVGAAVGEEEDFVGIGVEAGEEGGLHLGQGQLDVVVAEEDGEAVAGGDVATEGVEDGGEGGAVARDGVELVAGGARVGGEGGGGGGGGGDGEEVDEVAGDDELEGGGGGVAEAGGEGVDEGGEEGGARHHRGGRAAEVEVGDDEERAGAPGPDHGAPVARAMTARNVRWTEMRPTRWPVEISASERRASSPSVVRRSRVT